MISSDLLCMSCTARKVTGVDANRQKTYEDTELSKVRITATKKWVVSSTGTEAQDNLTLYFDCSESLPKGFIIENGMSVIWNGNTYTLNGVSPCYGIGDAPEFYKGYLV